MKKNQITEQTYAKLPKNIKPNYRTEGKTLIFALKNLADKIDTTKMKNPSFLMVLTGTGDFAYQREEDGVLVVPIGCLKD